MVANLDRAVKGGIYFIQSLPDIVRAVPQARFVVVGEADVRNLRRQARALGVDQCVVFAGAQTNVDDFYAAFDVSVLTSLSEGLSITILESMNHGLPVVATDVGGNREIIVNGETGFLVPPRSPRAFAAKVIEVLTQRSLRERLGHASRGRVQRCFTLQNAVEQYSLVYRRLTDADEQKLNRCGRPSRNECPHY
jgi:glycosyltransferase involved in cell wall biosynthesis